MNDHDYLGSRRFNAMGFEMRQVKRRLAALEAALGLTPPPVIDRHQAEDRKEETTDGIKSQER